MSFYQTTSNQANETNKWQNRIEKRRNDSLNVAGYVDQLIRSSHASLDDVEPFLTADESQEVKTALAERERRKADGRALAEAQRREQERKDEENRRLLAAFWQRNPPSPFTTVPECELTESELFDVLARYHIARVEYSFDAVHYHWEDFRCIEDPTIDAWLPSDIEVSLDDLPGDEDGSIGEAICEAIKELAAQRAAFAADEGRLQEGTVSFDVTARRVGLHATVEVTRDEDFAKVWSPDEDKDNC